MSRYLVLLAIHFLINFGLLPANAIVSHPVHHDDYSGLAASIGEFRVLAPRPVWGLVNASIAELGSDRAYLALNLMLVACVFLSLKFVELFARGGRQLPTLGFIAGGALAFGFAQIVDWTKYLGLLTNLCSALPGLAALCVIATIDNEPRRARSLGAVVLVLAALSFFAKEDFALPLLIATASLAFLRRSRWWAVMTGALAGLFALAFAFNRVVGSVFISGMRSPSDPYYIDFAPLSIASTFARTLLGSAHARWVVVFALAATLLALVARRADRALTLKLAALVAIPLSLLAPYSILPNHVFGYYAFVCIAMLSATLVVAVYAAAESRHEAHG